jgi:hypothetical protein
MQSSTESCAPNRAKLRSENVDPKVVNSNTDIHEDNLATPNTEKLAPTRAKLLKETEAPMRTKSITDNDEPRRPKLRSEIDDPKFVISSTDKENTEPKSCQTE